ncbi:MAG: cupin domain-containing protein [Candidatus Aquirickettsiella gammari]
MAIAHLASGQVRSILQLAAPPDTLQSIAIFKDAHLEVIRMVLPAAKVIPPHSVNGPITIQCLAGEVVVTADAQEHRLLAGDLQYFTGGVVHQLNAIQDSALLVTIVLLAAISKV